ncbi:hypothetical protein BsWGS_06891 [Bradybaena similaris]
MFITQFSQHTVCSSHNSAGTLYVDHTIQLAHCMLTTQFSRHTVCSSHNTAGTLYVDHTIQPAHCMLTTQYSRHTIVSQAWVLSNNILAPGTRFLSVIKIPDWSVVVQM